MLIACAVIGVMMFGAISVSANTLPNPAQTSWAETLTAQVPPTYTPAPTYTPPPTYTNLPTYTPLGSLPTYTPPPTYTPQPIIPTATPWGPPAPPTTGPDLGSVVFAMTFLVPLLANSNVGVAYMCVAAFLWPQALTLDKVAYIVIPSLLVVFADTARRLAYASFEKDKGKR